MYIQRRRIRWLEHVLRMDQDCIPIAVLRWKQPLRRKQGRPRQSYRRTAMAANRHGFDIGGETTYCAREGPVPLEANHCRLMSQGMKRTKLH